MTSPDQKAWGSFWQSRSGRKGILPSGFQRIDAAQTRCWEALARALPKRGHVLDLATGNGSVLVKMARVRRDLKLVGIDSAPTLPNPPRGITLKPRVPNEFLPFRSGSFDAVTSQFGFEYGDTAATASEVGRVLRPGGRLRFIVHHAEGPILAHNLKRRDALRWATAAGAFLETARAVARARKAVPIPTPASFRAAAIEARSRFPGSPVGEEFVTAIFQTLELGKTGTAEQALSVLDELEGEAANEIARIESLERAACDANRVARIVQQLTKAGLRMLEPQLLFEDSASAPFAWLLDGAAIPAAPE